MRWLLLKDLRLLWRSPLLVALLIGYPILVSVLIGFALSRGPDKPRVAVFNQVPESARVISLGGEEVDTGQYADTLYRSVDPIPVSSREEALGKVREGDALAALVVPPDITSKLQSGLEPAAVEVLYNAEDPVKAQFVRDTIKSQVQDANGALTRKFTEVALGYLDLLVRGGQFSFLGRKVDVLGLERSETILSAAGAELPERSPARAELERVIGFSRLARDNLDLSDELLGSLGTPIRVEARVVQGGSTPLSSFAVAAAVTVSVMFLTLLLAAGTLAAEREENAARRLLRGLVSGTGLLLEKATLAAACASVVALLMLAGLGLFVELDWGRLPLWATGVFAGALAFAAMGLCIGTLAREVRAASLLAFMVSLPLAFLALVPSGAVSAGLYSAIRIISALFPFKPALDAMTAALEGSSGIVAPLAHLAALALAFGALARLGLRRFA